MRQVYAIGETVYDIIFKENQVQTGRPGGSMLNSAVSMGRARLPIHFISEYGCDEIGNMIDHVLKDNSVNTHDVYRFPDGKTTVAIAVMDQKNNARYNFYRDTPQTRLNKAFPSLNDGDILLFGSYYSLAHEIREKVFTFVDAAKHLNALIIYDPNYRNAHLHELEKLRPIILENFSLASIVKGSDEDFKLIFGATTVDEAFREVSKYCPFLFYTMADKGVYFISKEKKIYVPTHKISPVSTIGAGDNFSAGIIYALYNEKIKQSELALLSEQTIKMLIESGIEFATDVCLSYDNYISQKFANSLFHKN